VAEVRTPGEPTGVLSADLERPAGAPRTHPASGGGRRRWAMVAGLLVLALVLRLGYVAVTPGYTIVHDARDYDHHAVSIAAGDGMALLGPGPSRHTAFRPPGYPYFLAGIYRLGGRDWLRSHDRIVAGRIANAVVGTAIVALLGLLCAQLLGRRVALVAMALAAVYLPLILVGGALMSEPLFAALLLGALVAAVQCRRSAHRWRWVVLAGVLGGLAILTRANAAVLLLPLALAVWDVRPRWSWRALALPALLVAVAALTVAPWTVRNAVELHAFVPVTTQLGTALAGTYNVEARADTHRPASWRSLRRVPELQYLVRTSVWRRTPEATLERRLRAVALRFIADHPGYVPKVVYWNTRRALELAGLTWARHTYSTVSVGPGWADAGVVMFWLCALLAIAGALTRRARRIPFHVAAVPVLLWLSVVVLAFETPRYRTGIDPFVVLLAAVALVAAWDVVRSGSAAGPARRPRAASTARYTGSARGRPDPGTGSRSA
jgi:4-amino-4-deoxy-L-arabinose transferase-like glycosyltransferase